MKQTLFLIVTVLAVIMAPGCKRVFPDGPAIRETRNVSGFSKIETTFGANVEYTKGTDSKVEVVASENLQRYVITEVTDGKLVLRTPDNVSIKKGSVSVYITAPALTGVTLTGSGNFMANDGIETGSMDLKVSGSGNLTIAKLTTPFLKTQISGNGDVTISNGESERQELTITGSGNYRAQQLHSGDARIKLTGSGDALVWVANKLDVTITGSGGVRYAGTPAVSASITGSGSVKAL